MPIPSQESTDKFVKLEIYDEVLRARVNTNSRYSFIKRNILCDLDIFPLMPAISIRVHCNGISEPGSFIISDGLEEDALLGTEFLREFNIQFSE